MARFGLSIHGWLLLGVFCAQIAFWSHTHEKTPDMGIVPNPPSSTVLDALSFGDPQFMFRIMAFQLGNAGDTFGRNTALYKYDLSHIEKWFTLLDELDATSNLLPANATYYFGQTQTKSDVRYMVTVSYTHLTLPTILRVSSCAYCEVLTHQDESIHLAQLLHY